LKCLCFFPLLLLILCGAILAPAQATDATISGIVVDPTGKVIPDVTIEIVNDVTGGHYPSATNGAEFIRSRFFPQPLSYAEWSTRR